MAKYRVIDGDNVQVIESELEFKGFQAITNWNYCIELLGDDGKSIKIGFGMKNPIDCVVKIETQQTTTKTGDKMKTTILTILAIIAVTTFIVVKHNQVHDKHQRALNAGKSVGISALSMYNKTDYQIQLMTAEAQQVLDREITLNNSLLDLCNDLQRKHNNNKNGMIVSCVKQ